MSNDGLVKQASGEQGQSDRTTRSRGGDGVSRRDFIRLAGVTAAGLALTACSPGFLATPTRASGQRVQLVYQDWRTDWFPPMAQKALDEFHATHPNIRVFYVPDPENLEEKMLDDMQSGTAPDVFQGCCTTFPIWAQEGYTLDLRPYVEADLDQATISDWDPAQYHALFLRDGRQFGVPKYHGALALYYNMDIFDEYGVPYPDASWTYDDYLTAMKQLRLDRDGDSKIDTWGSLCDLSWERVQVHVNAWGGHLVDPQDPRRCLWAEPPALEAQEWLRARMWDDKCMATVGDVQNRTPAQAFVAGKVAMIEDGTWSLKIILDGAKFRVGVAPMPAGPARRATLATTDGFGIYAGTKHPEAAWELVKFLISKEYGRMMARTNLLQPARESLVDEWIGYVRAEYPVAAKEMDVAAFADGHRQGYSVVAEIHANMGEAKQLADAAWERMFKQGTASVDEMVKAARKLEDSVAGGR